jgi:homogentisate 1,2-dioxygenase
MPFYRSVGEVPRKRHTAFRDADGALYHEELMGAEGFSAESVLLYHRHSPSAIVRADDEGSHDDNLRANVPLLPRHFRTTEIDDGGDLVTDRRVVVANDDVAIAWVAAKLPSPLYRNALGDELLYVQRGHGRLDSVFGSISVGPGDYVVIPCNTTHRWVPEPGEPLGCLVIEARGHVRLPRKYLAPTGQLLEHAPFCERDLRGAADPLVEEGDEVSVIVKHLGGRTRYRYAHHPFDVVGWDGCLYPYVLSIHDFEPIVGSRHQPPPVHQTFEGSNFVVCSFVPRPYDFGPDAIKVPYHHANVDSDEVLFYSAGDFMSRAGSGVGVGSITLHPSGFVHGPQPGSVEASFEKDRTEELAVMIDTFRPLQISGIGRAIDDRQYAFTWAKQAKTSAP